jgi:hypothetical protein
MPDNSPALVAPPRRPGHARPPVGAFIPKEFDSVAGRSAITLLLDEIAGLGPGRHRLPPALRAS